MSAVIFNTVQTHGTCSTNNNNNNNRNKQILRSISNSNDKFFDQLYHYWCSISINDKLLRNCFAYMQWHTSNTTRNNEWILVNCSPTHTQTHVRECDDLFLCMPHAIKLTSLDGMLLKNVVCVCLKNTFGLSKHAFNKKHTCGVRGM